MADLAIGLVQRGDHFIGLVDAAILALIEHLPMGDVAGADGMGELLVGTGRTLARFEQRRRVAEHFVGGVAAQLANCVIDPDDFSRVVGDVDRAGQVCHGAGQQRL
jgi:hypothetical protein